MIPFRHHVITLVATFLALAVGIALGGGPLTGIGRASEKETDVSDTVVRKAEFADTFARAGADKLYADGLNGRPVALLALPGADPGTVTALAEQVAAAGGTVSGQYAAGPSLTDPGEKALVDTLGSQLMTQLADSRVDPAAPTYVRLGQLLGLAVATTTEAGEPADEAAKSVRQGLAGADLLEAPADAKLGSLVLLVLPPGADDTPDQASEAVLSGLVAGLAARAAGVVVAGDAASAEVGDLAALRRGDLPATVASVDGVDAPLGRVTAVLGLIATSRGTGGSFGASGSDGAVPLG